MLIQRLEDRWVININRRQDNGMPNPFNMSFFSHWSGKPLFLGGEEPSLDSAPLAELGSSVKQRQAKGRYIVATQNISFYQG